MGLPQTDTNDMKARYAKIAMEYMTCIFIVICILCITSYATYYFSLKKHRYIKTINEQMNHFDYFLSSICIEQIVNKYLVFYVSQTDLNIMQYEVSELSAISWIECTCVSIHTEISNKTYEVKDKLYILGIVKENQNIKSRMYDNYVRTMKKIDRRKFFLAEGLDVTRCISFVSFCELFDLLIYKEM